jgi:hypothetical protein
VKATTVLGFIDLNIASTLIAGRQLHSGAEAEAAWRGTGGPS